jgi:hypothetical protein
MRRTWLATVRRASHDGDGVDLDEELWAQAGDDVNRDGRRRVGSVPRLFEGGETLVERVPFHHADSPVHDVGEARSLTLEDGREVAERLAGLLPDGGTTMPSASTPFWPPM